MTLPRSDGSGSLEVTDPGAGAMPRSRPGAGAAMVPPRPSTRPRLAAGIRRVAREGASTTLARYAVAVLATALAAGVSWLGRGALAPTPFLLLFPAVTVAAWAGGVGPGLLAALLCVLSADYLFLPPIGAFELHWLDDALRLAVFLAVAMLVGALTGSASRARREAEAREEDARRYAAELEQQGAELEQQMEESQTLLEEVEEQRTLLEAANAVAEAERERMLFMLQASRTLAGSLDYAATLAAVAAAAVPGFADWCAVDVLPDPESAEWPPRLERLAVAHRDPAKEQVAESLRRHSATDWDAPTGLSHVLRTGEAEYWPEVTDSVLRSVASDEAHLELLREIGFASVIIAPLSARGVTLGALTLVMAESERRFDRDDLALAQELAARAATAIDNARLFARAREARAAAEQLAERHSHLHRIAAALSSATTPARVAQLVIEEGMEAKGAAAATVLVVDAARTAFSPLARTGFGRAVAERYASFPLRAGGPASDAVLEDRPVLVESLERARAAGYEELAASLEADGHGSFAAVPIHLEGGVLGALAFSFPGPRVFDDAAVTFMRTLADLCGATLERARLYERAQAARAEAEEANRAKAQFLTVMSHELRTPLNAITGYTQILELGVHGPTTEKQRQSLARIHASARLQLNLINQVLNFAKVEAGHLEAIAEPTALVPLLEEMGELVQPQIEERAQRYTLEPCPGDPVIRTDGEKLRQVLLNLLTNASKFTPTGGEIRLACEAGPDQLRIHVDDSGPGIPPGQRDRVFEPFIQLGRNLTSAHQGTGLGLSISRDLARLLGGDLRVADRPDGPGARFTIELNAGE